MGVLLLSYGTPATGDDVEAYYTHIRRGRPPSAEQLADLVRRYDAIGGISPLRARTLDQATGVQDELGPHYRVVVGAKHAAPFIEDAVAGLADEGVERAVAVVLAPHFSALSVGEYAERARTAAGEHGIQLAVVDSWHLEPGLIELLTERVVACDPADLVVFTAHSLPERVTATGDPYAEQLAATAAAVATAAGITNWRIGWQSAGRTPEPWLGPDILDVIRGLPAEGIGSVLVCPCGFVADHLEVLYDLDVDAARVAAEVGVTFQRTASLNDDPKLMATLAGVVRRAAGS